jgi:alpha-L-arabinofuranosidase
VATGNTVTDSNAPRGDASAPGWTITREPLCPGAISPFQYGQFIEYLCALTPSMFAEKVFDGGFEGVPEYRVAFRKETDRIEQPWVPDGAVHRGAFELDAQNPFNGKVSQRIAQKPGDPCTLGVSQGGKYVKAGEAFTTCWGGLEPGNAGLEEFVKLCEWVGAEPLICIRFTGKTPKDAADEVEYFNGAPSTPMGARRAENGRAEPYHVKYWQIGSELGDKTYQAGIAKFCEAMKAADPSIKLMAAFPSDCLLKNAGQYLDYICPHHYGCNNLPAMESSVAECRKLIADNAPGRDIRLGITEWNTTAGDFGLGRAMLWTLDNALWCSRYHNFMHRHCDSIEIANRSNLTDSFCSGIIQPNNHSLFKTPAYYAQELYANHAGQTPLKVALDAGTASDPDLDVSATISSDGKRLALFVVHPTREAKTRAINLNDLARPNGPLHIWTIADTAQAGERDAVNSWQEPERIRTVPSTANLTESTLRYTFAPLSLTVLESRD